MTESVQISPRDICPAGRTTRLSDQRGAVLMHALLLVVVVVAAAGMMMHRTSTLVRGTLAERGELQALYAAEGGLAKARHALRRDPGFAGGSYGVGQCEATVAVRKVADAQWELTSHGVAWPAGRRGTPVQVSLVEGFGREYSYRRAGTR